MEDMVVGSEESDRGPARVSVVEPWKRPIQSGGFDSRWDPFAMESLAQTAGICSAKRRTHNAYGLILEERAGTARTRSVAA